MLPLRQSYLLLCFTGHFRETFRKLCPSVTRTTTRCCLCQLQPKGSYSNLVARTPCSMEWQALLHKQQTVNITSDASLMGWRALCNGSRTGGPLSHLEQGMHINCLELLAAILAAKTFLKD